MLAENLTGLLVLLFGYGYPAFECFKMLEQPSNSRQLQFWCKYWIIVAILTMIEMLGDFVLPLLPAYYSQAKLAFLVYLWHPKTMGSDVVYEAFLQPLVMQYEPDIEERLRRLRADSGRLLVFYLRNFTERGQTLMMEALRYAVSNAEARSSQRSKRGSIKEEENHPSTKEQIKRHGVEKLEEKHQERRHGVEKLEKKDQERRHGVEKSEEKDQERRHGVEKLEEKEERRHGVEKLEDIADILLATSEEKHRRRSSIHKKD